MIASDNLKFSYTDSELIINDISFTVNKHDRLGIIGPNGAGKTTLFHCLCGILKPESGSIKIADKLVQQGKFNPLLGFVFQNPDDQLFNLTVYDDIAFGPRNQKISKDEIKERVLHASQIMQCSNLLERSPHHLSGGEKRSVAIASVLSMNPEVLILDEPSSNLDIQSRRNLITQLKSLDQTMLISSHDLEFILETCTRVILIDKGKIMCEGEVSEVMSCKDIMLEHGMEVPHSLK